MPRDCFGRENFIEKIVNLAEKFKPIALIGAGGVGKTLLALTVLHSDRIKAQFGDDRRFIRCDQFTPSRVNFLSCLSKAIGAGVRNPENLNPLRPSLSSRKIFLVLDNAESIIDPHGAHAREIYDVVEELSHFSNLCLFVTSRVRVIPPGFEILDIPTLSMVAARDAFYRIHSHVKRSDSINSILKQLDFHPLSITLLATIADQNKWGHYRLLKEWEKQQAGVLRNEHGKTLAATIELSLSSPTFKELGPEARGILGIIAFFPQGINEHNLNWLFPTVSNGIAILNKLCILSLTYRCDGFVTMLAPLRDYFHPKDPLASSLLFATKERYFSRMSVELNPHTPGFREAKWISSEDVNVEHLLNFLISTNAKSDTVWIASVHFMEHLYWHKPRQTGLGPAIEELADNHRYKPKCLFALARLFQAIGNYAEQKRLLEHVLELERKRRNDRWIAATLSDLSDANRLLGLYEEGVKQAEEALEIHERLGDTGKQARCLNALAWLFYSDDQLDAAEEAAYQAIDLLPEKGQEFLLCQSHRVLGDIHISKGDREKSILHFETALKIASPFNWHKQLFCIHQSLAEMFLNEGEFDDAHSHIERAKQYALDNPHNLGCAVFLQAQIQFRRGKFDEAESEALRALEIFEKLGATSRLAACKALLMGVEEQSPSDETAEFGGEGLRSVLCPTHTNSLSVQEIPPRIQWNRHNSTGTNHLAPPGIQLSRSRSVPTQVLRQQPSSRNLKPAQPQPQHSLHQIQHTTSFVPSRSPRPSHHIRLVPFIDAEDFVWFDPVSYDVKEGDPPIKIGRFTGPPSPGTPSSPRPTNHLALKSEVVSPSHAEILVKGGKFFVQDIGSSRGTFLNHIRLSSTGLESKPFELEHEDVIQLGLDLLSFNGGVDKCVKIKVEINRGR